MNRFFQQLLTWHEDRHVPVPIWVDFTLLCVLWYLLLG